jgi:hypothetical protein
VEGETGRTDAFIAAWIEFAQWTADNVEGAGVGTLLRDTSDDHRFVSFGPWESLTAIENWRGLEGWGARVGSLRELLVSFEPATLELVAERG